MNGQVRGFRRDDDEVIVGLGSASPQSVRGLTEREARAIVRLGALSPQQWRAADSTRPPSNRWPRVLEMMSDAAARVLAPFAPLGSIAVLGDDVTRAEFARLLAPVATRVLHERADLDRVEAALVAAESRDRPPVDLAVLLEHDAVAPGNARAWHAAGIAHLTVTFTCDGCVVGPLVRAVEDPCIHCLDLHRQDHDRLWARVAAQCDDFAARPAPPPTDLIAFAAGLTASIVRGMSADDALPPGMTASLRVPRIELQFRRWPRHHRCPRHHRLPSPLRSPA